MVFIFYLLNDFFKFDNKKLIVVSMERASLSQSCISLKTAILTTIKMTSLFVFQISADSWLNY